MTYARPYVYSVAGRARSYRGALAEFKISLNPSLVIAIGLTFDDDKQAIEKLLKTQIPFDSIFALPKRLPLVL